MGGSEEQVSRSVEQQLCSDSISAKNVMYEAQRIPIWEVWKDVYLHLVNVQHNFLQANFQILISEYMQVYGFLGLKDTVALT